MSLKKMQNAVFPTSFTFWKYVNIFSYHNHFLWSPSLQVHLKNLGHPWPSPRLGHGV